MEWLSEIPEHSNVLVVDNFAADYLNSLIQRTSVVDFIDRTRLYLRSDYSALEHDRMMEVVSSYSHKKFQKREHTMLSLPPSNRYDAAIISPYHKLLTYVIDCLRAYDLIYPGSKLILLRDPQCPTAKFLHKVVRTFDHLTSGEIQINLSHSVAVLTKIRES